VNVEVVLEASTHEVKNSRHEASRFGLELSIPLHKRDVAD